jgi:hypothetical protein
MAPGKQASAVPAKINVGYAASRSRLGTDARGDAGAGRQVSEYTFCHRGIRGMR